MRVHRKPINYDIKIQEYVDREKLLQEKLQYYEEALAIAMYEVEFLEQKLNEAKSIFSELLEKTKGKLK